MIVTLDKEVMRKLFLSLEVAGLNQTPSQLRLDKIRVLTQQRAQ